MTQASVTIDPAAGIYTAIVAVPNPAVPNPAVPPELRHAPVILFLAHHTTANLLSEIADHLGWQFISYLDVVHNNAVSELRGIEE